MNVIKRGLLKRYYILLSKFAPEKYKEKYPFFLQKIGINIPDDYFEGRKGFIHVSVQFDANDYSLISIGKNTTISSEVIFLTHDYSIITGLHALGHHKTGRFLKPIKIGENCFVGMRSMLLPGTEIGDNVIIGSGSIVKGKLPSNAVYAGNPARFICSIEDWTQRHIKKGDILEG